MSIDLNTMPKLGFGLMRLPEKDGTIDMEHLCSMVDAYMQAGMNYFDTAYVYHGGNSEKVIREALVKRYPRDRFMLATKLPAWCMKDPDDRDRIFNEQLERCGVDYFDFYLLHSIEDGGNGETYERLDCFNWGLRKKAEGRIRHFGFSFHGSPAYLIKVLDAHPEVEFVQIQLNYADWRNPVVRSGELYEILHSRNIPMIIMEPVKGGTLAALKPELEEMYKAARPSASIASWALRFVGSLPGVMTILSGMSTEEQMKDNISYMKDFEPLSDEERALVFDAAECLRRNSFIPCTGCAYCVDGCPTGIAIPQYFSLFNDIKGGTEQNAANRFAALTKDHGAPGDCVACEQCQNICPQHIRIVDRLRDIAEYFGK